MKYFYTVTNQEIDIREIFTLGLTSKGDGQKIGSKGSGMKFTLALLHRLGSSLEVYTPNYQVKSRTETDTIRDIEHKFIFLESENETINTHITESAGSETWEKTAWFALRELLQNVLDENGEYFVGSEDALSNTIARAGENYTVVRVLLTEPLEKAWNESNSWFHHRHTEVIYQSEEKGLFFHGFKIFSAPDWAYAYDVTSLIERDKLSEDRQIRNIEFQDLFNKIAKFPFPDSYYSFLFEAKRSPDIDWLTNAVQSCIYNNNKNPGGFKIDKLDEVFEEKYGAKAAYTTEDDVNSSDHYYARAAGYRAVCVPYWTSSLLRYSEKFIGTNKVMPEVTNRLEKSKSIHIDCQLRLKAAIKITRKLRPSDCKVKVVKLKHNGDSVGAEAIASHSTNEVLLLESFVEKASTEDMVEALIEEYVHLSSGQTDGSILFEKALIKTIAGLLKPKTTVTDF